MSMLTWLNASEYYVNLLTGSMAWIILVYKLSICNQGMKAINCEYNESCCAGARRLHYWDI